ncbi:MAG: SMC-Scp complex subunit ScpB [Candidatus Dormibacteraeota bacterium]|nr:SMC-Scp complex subunit ScpB [Candidatus Dormibacteraeota bacterium]MBO0744835.1 SMC-Scp complex subunit ScpB [Candidatus Dormibacteraeota bacterium]
MSDLSLAAALEAILFTSNRPLKTRELQQATDASRPAVEEALRELEVALERRGVMLQRLDDQVHLVTRPELASYVRRALRPEASGRLSPAALETLAIVAYHQPVTRSRIERVRGVNSDTVLANLELRDLVREVGRETSPGQPRLYGTTMRFLQVMGLRSLDDLPPPPDVDAAGATPGEPGDPPHEEPQAPPQGESGHAVEEAEA